MGVQGISRELCGVALVIVDRYTDIQKLTPEIVREFVEKIVVHERCEPHKKKNYTQQIDVYFNFRARFKAREKP